MQDAPPSKPIIENYKHDARRIGGEAFSSPVVNTDKIAREPSRNSSNDLTRLKNTPGPVFLMHRPLVNDITTIISGKKKVTIAGIKAMSVKEICLKNGTTKPCGMLARTALRGLIRGRTLNCKAPKEDSAHITTSCKVGKTDIAEWLVKHGWTTLEGKSTGQSQ